MAVQLESAARLAALRDKADAVTGESSATLAGAVDALIAGFGAGGDDVAEEQLSNLISRGGAYSDMQTFVIPESVIRIGVGVFREWYYLGKVILHDAITHIGGDAFAYTGLTDVDLPASIVNLGYTAFGNCSALVRVTFRGTPTTIHTKAFSNNAGLVEINVPWAEGEVAGAPWGATNATINYNYTGD